MSIILFHAILTFILFGLILTIQCLHYPFFKFINPTINHSAHTFHQNRIGFIVGPLMVLELVTGIYLSIKMWTPFWQIQCINLVLILSIWIHTFFIMVPIHKLLLLNFNESIIRKLIVMNWIRTISWGIKSLLWALILWHVIGHSYG